jgi:hypothetical protein
MADDILSIYAQSQPGKPGVIDDKPDGTVVVWASARARKSCGAGRTRPRSSP